MPVYTCSVLAAVSLTLQASGKFACHKVRRTFLSQVVQYRQCNGHCLLLTVMCLKQTQTCCYCFVALCSRSPGFPSVSSQQDVSITGVHHDVLQTVSAPLRYLSSIQLSAAYQAIYELQARLMVYKDACRLAVQYQTAAVHKHAPAMLQELIQVSSMA